MYNHSLTMHSSIEIKKNNKLLSKTKVIFVIFMLCLVGIDIKIVEKLSFKVSLFLALSAYFLLIWKPLVKYTMLIFVILMLCLL